MKTLLAPLLLLPTLALAQVQVQIQLPTIRFEAPPPLVVVEPGIQVVSDYDDDLYVHEGVYWTRRDGRWFRSNDHRGNWVVVEERIVPVAVYKVPHGKYRKWKMAKMKEKTHDVLPAAFVPGKEKHKGDHHDGHHGKGKGKGNGKGKKH